MLEKVFIVLKMIYQLILYTFSLCSFFINCFFLCCNFVIPWLSIGLLMIMVATKFVKLKDPEKNIIEHLLGWSTAGNKDGEQDIGQEVLEFPIANK